MNEKHYPNCEERIDGEMADRLADLRGALEAERDDNEDAVDEYMEGVLEISAMHIKVRIGLSWGGPADGFYVYVDPVDYTIDYAEYYYQDWWDGAVRRLNDEELELVRDMFGVWIGYHEEGR